MSRAALANPRFSKDLQRGLFCFSVTEGACSFCRGVFLLAVWIRRGKVAERFACGRSSPSVRSWGVTFRSTLGCLVPNRGRSWSQAQHQAQAVSHKVSPGLGSGVQCRGHCLQGILGSLIAIFFLPLLSLSVHPYPPRDGRGKVCSALIQCRGDRVQLQD